MPVEDWRRNYEQGQIHVSGSFSEIFWSLFFQGSRQGNRIILDGKQKFYKGRFLPLQGNEALNETENPLDYLDAHFSVGMG